MFVFLLKMETSGGCTGFQKNCIIIRKVGIQFFRIERAPMISFPKKEAVCMNEALLLIGAVILIAS